MVKGLNAENFIKEFEPGSNPFEVTIVRLINPRGVDVKSVDKSILVKLLTRIKMRAFSDAHRKAFENLVKAIDVKEQFCGIFTPDVSEIYFDGDVMIVDLTSYLKPGMEARIGKLFQVAMDSPRVHEERIPNKELADRAITSHFLRNVGTGMPIADALRLAIQQQESGTPEPPPVRTVVTPPPLPPPPLPPPQPVVRTPKAEPPTVKVSADPMDNLVDGKIATMERVAKEKEIADAKDEATKAKRRAVKPRKKRKGAEDEEKAPEGEGEAPRPEPPTGIAPEMDDERPESISSQDTIPVAVEDQPRPTVDKGTMVPPPPTVTKEPDIDIRSMGTAPSGTAPESGHLGSLLSRLKGISLDAPKDLPKEAPKVSDELKAATPPPPKEEPKGPSRSIPPPPSMGEPELAEPPVITKAKEPDKPKSGESGLDELMKKLRSHR